MFSLLNDKRQSFSIELIQNEKLADSINVHNVFFNQAVQAVKLRRLETKRCPQHDFETHLCQWFWLLRETSTIKNFAGFLLLNGLQSWRAY